MQAIQPLARSFDLVKCHSDLSTDGKGLKLVLPDNSEYQMEEDCYVCYNGAGDIIDIIPVSDKATFDLRYYVL